MAACRARLISLLLLGWILSPSAALAQDQPSSTSPRTLAPAVLDRALLACAGGAYHAADLPRLRIIHGQLERYFAASSAGRKQIATEIEDAHFPLDLVGRLAAVRSSWTDLPPGVYYINARVGPVDIRYFLGIPAKYDASHSWPLVVKLPVANAFLSQPPPDADSVIRIYRQWMIQEITAHPDAVALMPLLNLDELYGPGPVAMSLVMKPILDCAARVNIDPARVYLTGHSMAANGVWNLAVHYPTYFAAINPMAGSLRDAWQRVRLGNLVNILCIVWADTSDDDVSVDESRSIVRYLQHIQYDVDYTETRDLGHMPSARIIEDQYQKMRSRARNLYPADVFIQSNSSETLFNRADWVQIYQPLSPGEQTNVRFSRGSQGMYLYQNTFRVTAQIADRHTIRLQTKNVQLLRLYLNDEMVDLNQPVNVIVNGESRFDAVIPRSANEMLKDQLFLGRGWRTYTAVLDLDLTEPPATRPAPQPHAYPPIEYIAPDGTKKVFVPKGD